MGYVLLNIVLAAVPSVIILVFIYRKDRGGKEPPRLVFMAFIVGFFAVIPAIILEILFSEVGVRFTGMAYQLFRAFIIAAAVEEGVKLGVVRLFLYKRKHFDEVADGILYTIAASLGFAFFENILYSFGPTSLIIVRGITAVPLHASASGILGYFIGTTKATGKNSLFTGLFWAIVIHGLYNFLLFTGSWPAFLVFPLLIISIAILRKLYKKAQKYDLESHAAKG